MIKQKRGSTRIWILVITILIIVAIAIYMLFFTGFGESIGSGIPSPPALPE